jgi:hypothetical protein
VMMEGKEEETNKNKKKEKCSGRSSLVVLSGITNKS